VRTTLVTITVSFALAATGCRACGGSPSARADDASIVVASASPPASASASAVMATPDAGPPAAATPVETDTQRSYRGTLGDKTPIEAFIERDGKLVRGSYRYTSVGRDLYLSGDLAPDGSMTLDEKVDEKKTGALRLALQSDGALVGTWSDPAGNKTFPVRLALRGVAPAGRATFFDFLVRLGRTEKQPPYTVTELDAAVQGNERFIPVDAKRDWLVEHGMIFQYASLYIADVNNDGVRDFVFVDMNTVSTHNDMLMGVYDEEGDHLRELSFFAAASRDLFDGGDWGPNTPAYRDQPFIEVTPKGTVMRWMNRWLADEQGRPVGPMDPCVRWLDEHFVFLWRGGTVSTTEHTRKLLPCK
jgi:hypothetical protein